MSQAIAGFFFTDTTETTTISVQDTYTDITGTTTANSQNVGFTHTNTPSALEYTGASAIDVEIIFGTSGGSASGNVTFVYALFVDTGSGYTIVTGFSSRHAVVVNGERESSMGGIITLDNGDKLKVMVKNISSTSDAKLFDYHLRVVELNI